MDLVVDFDDARPSCRLACIVAHAFGAQETLRFIAFFDVDRFELF